MNGQDMPYFYSTTSRLAFRFWFRFAAKGFFSDLYNHKASNIYLLSTFLDFFDFDFDLSLAFNFANLPSGSKTDECYIFNSSSKPKRSFFSNAARFFRALK